MQFKDLLISTLLIGLFIIALFQAFNLVADNNNKTNILEQNEALNRTIVNVNNSIKNVDKTINSTKAAFEDEKSSVETGFLLLGSMLSAGKVFSSIIINVFDNIFTLLSILGISAIVLAVFSGILVVIIVLQLWRLYKVGE